MCPWTLDIPTPRQVSWHRAGSVVAAADIDGAPLIDWQTYVAGIVTNTTVRDSFISALRTYASDGENNAPLSDWYDTKTGDVSGFRARPVVGGHLALVSYIVT